MCTNFSRNLHRDEDGSISIVAVFAVMLFTMLLGMVMNVGRQVDGKIRMQNAADASAYSGGVVLTRGMNTLAFTNHLLCEILATTAFLREAQGCHAEEYLDPILAAWAKEGPIFAKSGFPKFEALGSAITKKIPLEKDLVHVYCRWLEAASKCILPLLEEILAKELIPQYQRAVVAAFPDIAQTAAMEMANRELQPGRGKMLGVLWRTSGQTVGCDPSDSVLPVADPEYDTFRRTAARKEREEMALHYLGLWNSRTLLFFDREAKMSQFAALWRSFACGQLHKLLDEEYPDKNLPMMIGTTGSDVLDGNSHIDQHFTFLAVVYWKYLQESLPKIFSNSTEPDSVAFAQVQVFLPLSRIEWWQDPPPPRWIGGVPGDLPDMPMENEYPEPPEADRPWRIRRQAIPQSWDLWNQQWTCQLTPTTISNLATILHTTPPVLAEAGFKLPDFSNLKAEELGRINTH